MAKFRKFSELKKTTIKTIVFSNSGFSVSDGLVDKGVFVHSVKPDGPAARAGIHSYDKLLQINNTRHFVLKNICVETFECESEHRF